MPLVDSTQYFLIPRRRARRTAGALAIGLALSIALHPLWLPWPAQALIVSDRPQVADAIVVLGGGSGDREATAARLFAEGYAPVVITTGDKIPLPGLSDTTWADLSTIELERRGVPAGSIRPIRGSTSTCDDARLSLAALPAGARRLIVVTDPFHTRRAAWLFRRGAAPVDVVAVPAQPSWFDPRRWWTEDRGIIVVAQEYVKFGMALVGGCR